MHKLILIAFFNIILKTDSGKIENQKFQDDFIYYLNMARTQPQVFFKSYIIPFADSAKLLNSPYLFSLKKDISQLKPLGKLFIDEELTAVCSLHVEDCGPKGIVSHTGTNGKTFIKRTKEISQNNQSVCECIQYGFENARDVVCDLLIDVGVSDVGHRKCLLSSDKKYVGFFKGYHSKYNIHTVVLLKSE